MSTVYVLPWLGVSLYSINTLSCPYSKVFGLFVTIHEFAAGLQEFGISVTIYSQPWLHARSLRIWPVSVNIHSLTWTRSKFPGTWPVPVTIYSLHWPCNKFPGTWPVPVTIYFLPWPRDRSPGIWPDPVTIYSLPWPLGRSTGIWPVSAAGCWCSAWVPGAPFLAVLWRKCCHQRTRPLTPYLSPPTHRKRAIFSIQVMVCFLKIKNRK